MKFYDFLENELLYPLCHTSYIFEAYIKAVCTAFDGLMEDVKKLQKEFFCDESDFIHLYFKERALSVIHNEPASNLITRTIYAYAFYTGITGIKEVIKVFSYITNKRFNIILDKRPERNPFTYYIYILDTITDNEVDYLRNALREYINAHIEIVFVQQAFTPWIVGSARVGMIKIGGL